MKYWKIKLRVLQTIMELSKEAYPNEFSGMLIGSSEDKIIDDIYIIPATVNTQTSSTLRLDLVPMSFSVVGSVHSHPIPSSAASRADLRLFQSKYINIISNYPFSLENFTAYNNKGQEMKIEII